MITTIAQYFLNNLVITILKSESFFEIRCVKSITRVPFDHVNDDYCDCPLDVEASDEPSTGACVNAKFYCSGYANFLSPKGLILFFEFRRLILSLDLVGNYDLSFTL